MSHQNDLQKFIKLWCTLNTPSPMIVYIYSYYYRCLATFMKVSKPDIEIVIILSGTKWKSRLLKTRWSDSSPIVVKSRDKLV